MKLVSITAALFFSSICIAGEINIKDTGISFTVPDGFTDLSEQQIRAKWPGQSPPKWVVGNENALTTIAYDLKPNDIRLLHSMMCLSISSQPLTGSCPALNGKKVRLLSFPASNGY